MNTQKTAKLFYILSAASLVLPWFSDNANIMGYRFGSEFYVLFIVPMLMVWHTLFGNGPDWIGIIGAITDVSVLIYAMGGWMKINRISSEFVLKEGIHSTVFGFWISGVLFMLLLAAVITKALQKDQSGEMEALICC